MGKPGISLEAVKNSNKSGILKLLLRNGAASRKDIAASMGLTPAAVTLLTNEMIEEGIIVEKGELQEEKRAGRRKVLVDIDYDCKWIVSVSIEAVDTWISITNIKGKKLAGTKIATQASASPEAFLEAVSKEIKLLLWDQGKGQPDVIGVGVCVPGIVNRSRGVSIHAYGVWSGEVEVRRILERFLPYPVVVENNVKAFAEGEMLYGAGKYGDNLLFIKWGPGVGSAIVIGNKLYEGFQHNAAEIGHYIVDPEGSECRCGRRGCLETKVSTRALAERMQAVYSRERTPKLFALTEGRRGDVTRSLITAWFEEDAVYLHGMDEPVAEILTGAIEELARVVVNVLTILAPDQTILFGPMLENEDACRLFVECCRRYDPRYSDESIHRSKLSRMIFHIGGTALVARTFFFENGGAAAK